MELDPDLFTAVADGLPQINADAVVEFYFAPPVVEETTTQEETTEKPTVNTTETPETTTAPVTTQTPVTTAGKVASGCKKSSVFITIATFVSAMGVVVFTKKRI